MKEKKQPPTVESLHSELREMELKVKQQKSDIAALSARLANNAGRLKLFERVVDSRYDVKLTEQMEKRQRETNAIIQRLMFKTTVVTEVCYYARNTDSLTDRQRLMTLAAAVFCFDADESFWSSESFDMDDKPGGKDGLSVSEWAQKCVKYYNASRLALVTRDKISA
jgi:hypothetical protein